MIRNLNRKKFEGIPCLERRNSCFSVDSSNIDIIDRPNLSSTRKNVSFNKDIDVGIFRKDSKNLKLIESYLQPLPVPFVNLPTDELKQSDDLNKRPESPLTQRTDSTISSTGNNDINNDNRKDAQDHIRNILNSRNSISNMNSLFSIVNRRTSSPISTVSSENRYTNRASICSKRKFPADTPVKNLEPTLKMIIIKELSEEKIDGKTKLNIYHKNMAGVLNYQAIF